MGLFKANLGNLVQHWTLCEVLEASKQTRNSSLFFLCAHSMAPWSNPEPREAGPTIFHCYFDAVREHLFSQLRPKPMPAPYETAWTTLSPPAGVPYPSSAVFATNIWRKNLSLWLCENDEPNAAEISNWWNRPDFEQPLLDKRIYENDWQRCFINPLPLLFDRASACDVALLEFDPNMIICQKGVKSKDFQQMYPEDIELIRSLLRHFSTPIILQFSSHSTEGGNTPRVVQEMLTESLAQDGFSLAGQVIAKNSMTSLVYSKAMKLWEADPLSLSESFNDWLSPMVPMVRKKPSFSPENSGLPAKSKPYLTHREAVAKFLYYFSKGFYDADYILRERKYKLEAHTLWCEKLGRVIYRKLLTKKRYGEIVRRALEVEQSSQTSLLASFEKIALSDAVKVPANAKRFAVSLFDLIYGGDSFKSRFERFAELLDSLPQPKAKLRWPVQTIFPFLALPKEHVFLKPEVTKEAAGRRAFSLNYRPEPNWLTYSCLLTLAKTLMSDLADLKPRDMIDIQSFIFVTGDSSYT